MKRAGGGGIIIGVLVGLGIGVAFAWRRTQLRLEKIEQRLSSFENRIISVENKILEFHETYQEDRANIMYQYRILKREMEQLHESAISPERKRELDEWLDFLNQITNRKIQEKITTTAIPAQVYIS